MHHDADISILSEEVASLRALVHEQAAELAALRQTAGPDTPVSRRHLMRGLAGLGAAGVAGMVATAEPAAAADGDNLVLGQDNTATAMTTIDTGPAAVGLHLQGNGFSVLDVTGSGVTAADHGITASGDATGVSGQSDGVGVFGRNLGVGPGIGGSSLGGGPQLWLDPTDGAPPGPPPGAGGAGLVRFDSNGDIWICLGEGDPGTWTRLLREDTAPGRVIPITPFRALDTRRTGGRVSGAPVIPGQVKGPLTDGQVVTLDLAGVAPIPASATGVMGNAIVSRRTSAGKLQILPAGAVPATATSTVNFTAESGSNSFASGLSASGLSAVATLLLASGTYELIIDITAYIT